MNRRDFLKAFSSAIAAAGIGVTLAPKAISQITEQASLALQNHKVHARHLYQYSANAIRHRIDVKFSGKNGIEQWGVDLLSASEKLDPERELAPALTLLNNILHDVGYEVGEIHSYSYDEWASNPKIRDRWESLRIGDI